MYIGSTDTRGLHHLVYEVVDNSVDEALAKYCDHIWVSVNEDGSCTVEDNGRGIPVDRVKKTGKSALETVLTVLHAGGKFDKNSYQVSGGLHGVGVSVVNALSTLSTRRSTRRNIYEMEFRPRQAATLRAQGDQGGIQDRYARATVSGRGRGLTSREPSSRATDGDVRHRDPFTPDPPSSRRSFRLFDASPTACASSRSQRRPRDQDRGPAPRGRCRDVRYDGGSRVVKYLNEGKTPIQNDVVRFQRTDPENRTEVEVGLQYTNSYAETIYTYVNSVNTREGGTHLEGFRSAITRAINTSARRNNLFKNGVSLRGEDVREGMTAVISIKIANPQFEGQTKMRLGNSNVRGIVDSQVYASLSEYSEENPVALKAIVEKGLLARRRGGGPERAPHAAQTMLESSTSRASSPNCRNAPGQVGSTSWRATRPAARPAGADRKFQAICRSGRS